MIQHSSLVSAPISNMMESKMVELYLKEVRMDIIK